MGMVQRCILPSTGSCLSLLASVTISTSRNSLDTVFHAVLFLPALYSDHQDMFSSSPKTLHISKISMMLRISYSTLVSVSKLDSYSSCYSSRISTYCLMRRNVPFHTLLVYLVTESKHLYSPMDHSMKQYCNSDPPHPGHIFPIAFLTSSPLN